MRTKTVAKRRIRSSSLSTSATPSISTPTPTPHPQDNNDNRIAAVDDGNRNPQLRKDNVWNRWVIFSPAGDKRPSDFKYKPPFNMNPNPNACSYCIGHERKCAPEIFRFPPDEPEWTIRVIQNIDPALSRNLPDPNWTIDAPAGSILDGFGFHDVVIETPLHSVQLCDLSPEQIGDIFVAYTNRIQQLANHYSIKYIQVYKDHGVSSGASMSHSHSQMLALPIIPPSVSARLGSTKDYFIQTGKCCICESKREDLLIDSSAHFFSLVPFAATFPFEIWIVPRHHSAHFHELGVEQAVELGGLLKQMLRRISLQLKHPPFNFMIHTSPLHGNESELAYAHWFIQIVPQLTETAGFELETGCYINPVFPEDAAKVLREVKVPAPNKPVDYSDAFTTKKVFSTRDDLLDWARAVGRENGFVVVILKSDNGGKGKKTSKGRKQILILGCEKGGKYRQFKNAVPRKVSGTKKCECPFRLRGRLLRNGEGWKVNVVRGFHNHEVGKTFMGHAYAGPLSGEAKSLVDDMTKNMAKPRDILMALKVRDADNACTIRQIYNARHAFRVSQKDPEIGMQDLMDMSE